MSWWDQISGVGSDLKGIAEALTYLPGYTEAIKAFPQILSGDTADLPLVKPSTFEERIQSGLQNFVEKGKTNPEEVVMDFMPGAMSVIKSNFRSPTAIQELRKLMAEEMQSRGPIGQVGGGTKRIISPEGNYATIEQIAGSDPTDQILRGSWYHGMSKEARDKVSSELFNIDPGIWNRLMDDPRMNVRDLVATNETGFPISHHDAASMSGGKLGEPSGTSLSMLPTKAVSFNNTGDEFIHRVLPRFGGSPQERIINLMTPEGRKALNDAYDVVANQKFNAPYLASKISGDWKGGMHLGDTEAFLGNIGSFNQVLSEQLQSQGKRGILYNPQRWNEYEMLMLDPKYALPLDYRKFQEYGNPSAERWRRTGNTSLPGGLDTMTATPGTRKGLSQIQDLMSQNKSRLGDVYSERPWTQRLSEENKRRLLDLIDPQYREIIGNQLYE